MSNPKYHITGLKDATSESERLTHLVNFLGYFTYTSISMKLVNESKSTKMKGLNFIFLREVLRMFDAKKLRSLYPYMFNKDDTSWFNAKDKLTPLTIEKTIHLSEEVFLLSQLPDEELCFFMEVVADVLPRMK